MWAGIRPAKPCSTCQQDCQRHTTLSHCSLQKEKKHPLTLKKQAIELLTAKKQLLQDFKTLYSYQGNSHQHWDLWLGHAENIFSSSSTHTGVTHVDIQGHNEVLSCWDSGWDVNFLTISYLQVGLRASLQKWNYPGAGAHAENTRLPQLLHCMQPWGELVKSRAKHSAGIKLWLWGEVYRRTLSRQGRRAFLTSRMAEWAAPSSTCDMLHASLPALQRPGYR